MIAPKTWFNFLDYLLLNYDIEILDTNWNLLQTSKVIKKNELFQINFIKFNKNPNIDYLCDLN